MGYPADENEVLENRLFRSEHFIPILGLKKAKEDIELQTRIDDQAPIWEAIPRVERLAMYEVGLCFYNAAILAPPISMAIVYAIQKFS